jgi:superfamily II DNA or RNA helicase
VKQTFKGWQAVASELKEMASDSAELQHLLNAGQRASLRAIADRIVKNGVILADEVGMGKTRIAVFVAKAVVNSGGRVAVVVPPGLGFQWQREFRDCGTGVADILRSMHGYFGRWSEAEPLRPWFDDDIMLVSHRFADWRMRPNSSQLWRRALLPEVYAEAQRAEGNRRPNGYGKYADSGAPRTAAQAIVSAAPKDISHPARGLLDQLLQRVKWKDTLVAEAYFNNGKLRPWHEKIVGLGLGAFDLIIVDEAHKNRSDGGGLSTLLNSVLLVGKDNRRLALTATPIEIDVSQWKSILTRINASTEQCTKADTVSKRYLASIHRLRQCWRTDADAREEYRCAAKEFQTVLSPFVLRRDKRVDDDVKAFMKASGKDINDYRQMHEVDVDVSKLTADWQEIVCAAEALSIVEEKAIDARTKRLRLTVGNGHGIASIIGAASLDATADAKQIADEKERAEEELKEFGGNIVDNKIATSRCNWWASVLKNAVNKQQGILFDHPAILAAVLAIEAEVTRGEKVLVFGRFTIPMRARVDLLNARQMLRAVELNTAWPQSKVYGERHGPNFGEWPAVCAAHRQLASELDLDKLDDSLVSQYRSSRPEREKRHSEILDRLTAGLTQGDHSEKYRAVLDSIRGTTSEVEARTEDAIPLLAEAVAAGSDNPNPDDTDLAKAFVALVDAATDQDNTDSETYDDEQAQYVWGNLAARLSEEYSNQRGRFSRLMNGETKQQTRRMIQLAFNRPNSFPRVLVAQSLVGREGLNLHESCRIVILLHPEWNPGVVEQQIGRVDRVNSRWAKELKKRKLGQTLPRIEIRPIIFKGTYDEHNWRILKERWEDLRAQLHGEALPARLRLEEDQDGIDIFDELARSSPNFYP